MFTTLVAIGVIALILFIIALIIGWATRAPFMDFVAKHSGAFLAVIFICAMLGSLIFEHILLYPPCILCWYQRIFIFPIGIIALTANLRSSKLLQNQVLALSIIGFAIALFHNYLDIFQPAGLDVCGTDGISCSARYVYEFGFVTIPLMSAIVLGSAILLTLIAKYWKTK